MNIMSTPQRLLYHLKGMKQNLNLNTLKPASSIMPFDSVLNNIQSFPLTKRREKCNYGTLNTSRYRQQEQKQQQRICSYHTLHQKDLKRSLISGLKYDTFNIYSQRSSFPKRGITTDADQHFILTATGPDRVGIVSDIAKIVLDNQGDIAESRMVRMGGDFTAMMRACATKAQVETITDKLYTLQSVHCLVHYVSNHDFQTDTNPVWEASVTLQGANHPGIVFRLTDLFKKYSIRVQDMHTDTELAPFGGTELFLLDAIVVSDTKFDTESFYEEIDQIQHQLGIDIDIEEIDRYGDQEENQLKSA